MSDPAIVIERVIEWADTDAAGHAHNTVASRLLEAAEGALMRELGLQDLAPHMPRVRVLAEYHAPLFYGQTVRAELRIGSIGRTSLTWSLVVRDPQDAVAITVETVVVHAPGRSASPWPDDVRSALIAAGDSAPA